MFKKIEQTNTPSVHATLKQLREGALFTFHSIERSSDRVFMKLENPPFGKKPDPNIYVVDLKSGKVVAVHDCEVNPVDATMTWHYKPWSVQV